MTQMNVSLMHGYKSASVFLLGFFAAFLQSWVWLFIVFRIFGKFGYGFGLQKDSPFTQHFSVNVLELRQKGYMETMKTKWLSGTCEKDTESRKSWFSWEKRVS